MSCGDPCQHKNVYRCHCCQVTQCLDCGYMWESPKTPFGVWPESSARRFDSLQSSTEANADIWRQLADFTSAEGGDEMTDCKHEHLVHCQVCDTVRCADCGKVWTFEQDRATTPAMWPPNPHYVPPEFYRSWPEIGGPSDETIPPPVDGIIITCGEGMTGTVVSERDNITLTYGVLA